MKRSAPLWVRQPWLFVAGAFLLLMAAWSTLIVVALKHAPTVLEAPQPRTASRP